MVLVIFKPWTAFGVMDELRVRLMMVEHIPLPGNIANPFVGDRFESMQPLCGLGLDTRLGPGSELFAIQKHEARPILSRILRLNPAVHLDDRCRPVLM